MSEPQPTGVDLARVVLRAARQNARRRSSPSAQKAPAPRHGRRDRADGRDPVGLGTALARLIEDRAWDVPVQGGSVLEEWPSIAGDDLAAHVRAVHFDPDTRTLDLRPDSPAYRTQIRLLAPRLLDRIREHLGTDVVRRIRDLAPGAPADAGQPRRTEPTTPGGARRAPIPPPVRDQQAQPPNTVDPAPAAASGQPPSWLLPDAPEEMDHETAERRRKDRSHARALAYARRQRAQRKAAVDKHNQHDR
jgi:predicted nucleic acid-binding Zn ribbon protein